MALAVADDGDGSSGPPARRQRLALSHIDDEPDADHPDRLLQYMQAAPTVPAGLAAALQKVDFLWGRMAHADEETRTAMRERLSQQLARLRDALVDDWIKEGLAVSQVAVLRRLRVPATAANMTADCVDRMFNEVLSQVRLLENAHHSLGMFCNNELKQRDVLNRLYGGFELLKRSFMIMDHAQAIFAPTTPLNDTLTTRIGSELSFDNPDDERLNDYQRYLQYLLRTLHDLQYRRMDKDCCQQIVTPEGYATRAWRPVMTIRDFVAQATQRHNAFQQWKMMTSNSRNYNAAVEYLTNIVDSDFSQLKPDQFVRSFRDGVWFMIPSDPNKGDGDFYRYDDPELFKRGNFVSDHYYDINFCHEGWDTYTTPCEIQTDNFDTIFHSQEYTEELLMWVYIVFGRLFYPLGMFDNWQVLPVFLGASGTGKSTIGETAAAMFNPRDVRLLSANTERTFGLQGLRNARVWVCFEMNEDLNFSQSILNSMISGEPVNIPIKNQESVTMRFTATGLACGNTRPKWSHAGSMARRSLIFNMGKSVPNRRTDLPIAIKGFELPRIMRKANWAYRLAVSEAGDRDVWSFAPKPFVEEHSKLCKDVSPLIAFIEDPIFLRDKKHWIRWTLFQRMLTEHQKNSLSTMRRIDAASQRQIFQDHEMQVVFDEDLERAQAEQDAAETALLIAQGRPVPPVHPEDVGVNSRKFIKGICLHKDRDWQQYWVANQRQRGAFN